MKSSTAPRVFPSRPSSGGGGGVGGSSSGDRPPSLTQRDRERQRELERSARAAAAATLASGLPLVPTDPVAGPEHHLHHHSLPVFGAPTHTTEEDESSRLIKSVLGDFTDFAQTVLKSHASTDHPSALGISSREVKVRKVEQIFNEMKKPFGEPISGLDDLDDGGGSNSSTNLTPRLPPPLPFSSKFASSYSSGSLSSGPALTSAPPPPLGPSLGVSSNTHLSQQPPAPSSTTLAATTIPNRKSHNLDHSSITNLHPHPLLQSSLPQTTAASDDPSPPPSHHQTPPTIKVVDATHLSSPFSDSVKKRKLTPTPPPPSSFEAPSSRSAAATTNTLHSQPAAAAAASATQSQTNSRRSHGHRQRKSTTDQSDSSPSDGSSSSSSSSAESEGEDGEESSASSVESGEIDGEEASDKASVASQSTVGKATSTLNGCWDLDNFIESTKPEKRESSKERDKERDKEKSSSGSNSTKKGAIEVASGVGSSSKYSRDTQNLSSNHQDLTATLHEYVNRNSASLGPKGPGSKASTTTSQAKSQPVNSLHDAPDAKPAHLTNGTSSTASSTPPSFIVSLSLNRLNRIPCVDRNGNVAHAQNGHGTEKSSKTAGSKATSVSGSTEKDSHLNEENCPPLSSALSLNSKKDKMGSKKTAREESGTGESPAKRPKGESVASSKGTREAREAIKKERDKETITTTGSKRDREKDRGEEKAPKSLMANIPLTSIKSKKGGGGATLPEEKVSTPRSSSKEKHKETPGKKERTGTGGAKETSKERGSTTVDGLKSLKSRNASGTPSPSSTSLLAKASPMARSSPGVNLVASSIQPARDAPSSRDPLRPSATYTSRSLFDSSPLGIYHFLARYNPSMNEGESQANAKLLKRQADKQGECKQKQLTLYLEAVIYFIQMAMRIEGVRLDTDSAYHIYKDTLSLLKMTTQNFIKSPQTRLSGESCSVQDIKLAILAYRCQAALMLKLNRMRSKEMHENKELISGFMAQTSIQAVLSHGPEKSGASSVTMPPTTLQACSKQLTLLQTYQTVVELWSKSEQLIERHEVVKEFFASMHSHPLVGYLHLSSPFDHLINYLLNGIRNL